MPKRPPAQDNAHHAPEQLPLDLGIAAHVVTVKTLPSGSKLLPREVCSSVDSPFMPPDPLTVIQISLDSLNQPDGNIINATRQPGGGEWNGWVIWGGTASFDASFDFKALKVVNVLERCPELMPYLALGTGFSVSITGQSAEIFPPATAQMLIAPATEAPPSYVAHQPATSRTSTATKLFFLASILLHAAIIIFIGVADPNATKGSESRAGRASSTVFSLRINPKAQPQAATSTASKSTATPSATSRTPAAAQPAPTAPPTESQPLPAALATANPSTAVTPMREAPVLTEPISPIATPNIAVAPMRDAPLLTTTIAPSPAPSTAVATLNDVPLLTQPIAPVTLSATPVNPLRDTPVFTTPLTAVNTPSTAVATLRDAPILTTPIAPVRAPSTTVTSLRDSPLIAPPLTTAAAPSTSVTSLREAPLIAPPLAATAAPSTRITPMREAPILSAPIAPIAPPSTAVAAIRDAPILTAPIAPIAPPAPAIAALREAPIITAPIAPIAAPALAQQIAPAPVFAPAPAQALAEGVATPTPSASNPGTVTASANPSATTPGKATPSTTVSSNTVDNIFGPASTEPKVADSKPNLSIDPETIRQRMRESARNKDAGEFLTATEKRPAFALALAPKVVRKTKEEIAIEQAWKPDCRTAYKDSPLGLAAIGPLIWGAVSDNAKCKW